MWCIISRAVFVSASIAIYGKAMTAVGGMGIKQICIIGEWNMKL